MTVEVGSTYCDITIDPSVVELIFPPDIYGTIRPGSLDGLKLAYVIWGEFMGEIETGTIPDGIALVLRSSYKYPLDRAQLGSTVKVFIHESCSEFAPTDRTFAVWSDDVITLKPNIETCSNSTTAFMIVDERMVRYINFLRIKSVTDVLSTQDSDAVTASLPTDPMTAADPLPTDPTDAVTAADPLPTDPIAAAEVANSTLLKLCQEPDQCVIEAYIKANRKYLCPNYRNFACLRELIKTRDLVVCMSLINALGPVPQEYIQNLIGHYAYTDHIEFVLDLAEGLGITAGASLKDRDDMLFYVSSRGADLELVKRVHNLNPEPAPVLALRASFYGWNRTVIDHYVSVCKDMTVTRVCMLEVFGHATKSCNPYALKQVFDLFAISWRDLNSATYTSTYKNVLDEAIRDCASDLTGLMLELLIGYLNRDGDFGELCLDPVISSETRAEYMEAVILMCKSGQTNAAGLLVSRLTISKEQVYDLVTAASTIEAVGVIAGHLVPQLKWDTIEYLTTRDDQPLVRKLLAAYYRFMAAKYDC